MTIATYAGLAILAVGNAIGLGFGLAGTRSSELDTVAGVLVTLTPGYWLGRLLTVKVR